MCIQLLVPEQTVKKKLFSSFLSSFIPNLCVPLQSCYDKVQEEVSFLVEREVQLNGSPLSESKKTQNDYLIHLILLSLYYEAVIVSTGRIGRWHVFRRDSVSLNLGREVRGPRPVWLQLASQMRCGKHRLGIITRVAKFCNLIKFTTN